MDGPIDGQCFSHTDAINTLENDDFPTDFATFTKALSTDGPTNGAMDGPTNGPTDQWTDKPPYRDAIAASEKNWWTC